MKFNSLLLIAGLLSASAAIAEEKNAFSPKNNRPLHQTVQSGAELQFDVKVEPEHKNVVVTPIQPASSIAPAALQMQFVTKEEQVVPVELKVLEAPGQATRYAGKLDRWNDSFIAFELRFSFDKKTWKRVRHSLRADQ